MKGPVVSDEITLVADDGSQLRVDPLGGRLTSLQIAGHEVLAGATTGQGDPDLTVPESFRGGCFPMAPYAGRVRRGELRIGEGVLHLPITAPPHAIHGLVLDVPWMVVAQTMRSVELAVSIPEPWPWRATVRQLIDIRDGGVDITLTVTRDSQVDDAGNELMPAWIGLHPWFRRQLEGGAGPVRIDLPFKHMQRRDAEGIATGELIDPGVGPWDDCFEGEGMVTLAWPDGPTMTLSADTEVWVVFTERANEVCVEPQTAPPDALALNRAALLDVGETCSLTFAMRW